MFLDRGSSMFYWAMACNPEICNDLTSHLPGVERLLLQGRTSDSNRAISNFLRVASNSHADTVAPILAHVVRKSRLGKHADSIEPGTGNTIQSLLDHSWKR